MPAPGCSNVMAFLAVKGVGPFLFKRTCGGKDSMDLGRRGVPTADYINPA